MIEKGVVGLRKEKNKRLYYADPSGFIKAIEQKEKELINKEKLAKEVIKYVRISKSLYKKEEGVYVFYGENSFKHLFLAVLGSGNHYLHLSRGGRIVDNIGKQFYVFSQTVKKRADSFCNAVLCSNAKNHSFVKSVSNSSIRWLPEGEDMPSTITISSSSVLITDWNIKPIVNVLLCGKNFVGTYRSLFKGLWKNNSLKLEERFM